MNDHERFGAVLGTDHPNIARVLEGGTTGESSRHTPCAAMGESRKHSPCAATPADGTPSVPATSGQIWFVAELFKGVPITRYRADFRNQLAGPDTGQKASGAEQIGR
jgi:hypothetical protein